MRNRIASTVILAALAAAPAFCQVDYPRASPKATVTQTVGMTEVSIAYCRPGVKGRTIWGDLVPYDQVWRTGANEATTITFGDEVTIGGTALPAGTYGLFTIPGKNEWTIVINKGAKLWGAYEYKQAEDVVRVKATPSAAPFAERLTFTFANVETESADVVLAWDKVQVSFPIKVDAVAKALGQARQAVAGAKADDWMTPLRAAGFCIDNKVNLDEANAWLDKALAANEHYYVLLGKARLYSVKGDGKNALAWVNKAIAKGKASTDVDLAPAQRLLAELQGKK
jgi:hypothetical protein